MNQGPPPVHSRGENKSFDTSNFDTEAIKHPSAVAPPLPPKAKKRLADKPTANNTRKKAKFNKKNVGVKGTELINESMLEIANRFWMKRVSENSCSRFIIWMTNPKNWKTWQDQVKNKNGAYANVIQGPSEKGYYYVCSELVSEMSRYFQVATGLMTKEDIQETLILLGGVRMEHDIYKGFSIRIIGHSEIYIYRFDKEIMQSLWSAFSGEYINEDLEKNPVKIWQFGNRNFTNVFGLAYKADREDANHPMMNIEVNDIARSPCGWPIVKVRSNFKPSDDLRKNFDNIKIPEKLKKAEQIAKFKRGLAKYTEGVDHTTIPLNDAKDLNLLKKSVIINGSGKLLAFPRIEDNAYVSYKNDLVGGKLSPTKEGECMDYN